jgi:hypothetical protein
MGTAHSVRQAPVTLIVMSRSASPSSAHESTQSGQERGTFGFAADSEGKSLPGWLAPWQPTGEGPIEPPDPHGRFTSTETFVTILAAVMDVGFYAARDDILRRVTGYSMAQQ